jgi:hypothetical protein
MREADNDLRIENCYPEKVDCEREAARERTQKENANDDVDCVVPWRNLLRGGKERGAAGECRPEFG